MIVTPVSTINASNYNHYSLIHHGTLALGRAERVGMRIDMEYCEKMKKHFERKIKFYSDSLKRTELAKEWKKVFKAKTNLNSGDQLSKILYGTLGLTTEIKSEKGNNAISEEALSLLDVDGLDEIIKIRSLSKAKDTYLAGFMREQVDGIIHPFFNLHIPRTFRSSSDSPNFQNIPNRDKEIKKAIRKAIKPREGNFFLFVDYSGAEVRVGNAYHKDPSMTSYLVEGGDMHKDVAVDSFLLKPEQVTKNIRFTAKNRFTFAEFYGDYYKSCAKGMWSEAQKDDHALPDGTPMIDHLKSKKIKNYAAFEKHMEKVESIFWDERFKVYKKWKEDLYASYLKKGHIQMLSGFKCSGVMGFNDCVNYPIQGSAFHCLLLGFILIDHEQEKRKWKSKLVGQIHDEVIMDIHPSEFDEVLEVVLHIMQEKVPEIFNWINVPMIAEPGITPINGSWYDKTDMEDIDDLETFLHKLKT